MSFPAIDDTSYEMIKSHILNPDSSPLPIQQQNHLDRIIAAGKILDKNPIAKNAAYMLRAKYPEISFRTAIRDVSLAMRLFNTIHSFDYDFWHTWLINDIVANITKCNNDGSPTARKTIAIEHANLLKAIGEKPTDLEDPKRLEKQSFYILIQNNTNTVKVDVDNLHKLPEATLREINRIVFTGKEITETDAEEIFKT
ncbi:MAG: hypothetical protein ACOYN4_18165 [Bacteroidales bacterium]